MKTHSAARRTLLKNALALTMSASTGIHNARAASNEGGSLSKTLVAFYSRTSNTRLVAKQIRRARNTAIFEIETREPYPEDYDATVAQAADETKRGFHPPLRANIPTITSFDTVFLGFPIWGMTAPPVIRSFLSAHDLKNKTLIPFITHGGYGRGNALKVIAQDAPGAQLVDGFLMEGEQERKVLAEVTGWLAKLEPIQSAR